MTAARLPVKHRELISHASSQALSGSSASTKATGSGAVAISDAEDGASTKATAKGDNSNATATIDVTGGGKASATATGGATAMAEIDGAGGGTVVAKAEDCRRFGSRRYTLAEAGRLPAKQAEKEADSEASAKMTGWRKRRRTEGQRWGHRRWRRDVWRLPVVQALAEIQLLIV